MEAAAGSSGLAPPTPDDHGGAVDDAGMMVVDDGGGGSGGGQPSEEVPSELRDQALGLISDAQTAGDRREKEALLKQVWVGAACNRSIAVDRPRRRDRSEFNRSIDRRALGHSLPTVLGACQVDELVLHRAPGLLDEVVPTLIAEFQVRR